MIITLDDLHAWVGQQRYDWCELAPEPGDLEATRLKAQAHLDAWQHYWALPGDRSYQRRQQMLRWLRQLVMAATPTAADTLWAEVAACYRYDWP